MPSEQQRAYVVFVDVHPSQAWKLVVHMEANPRLFSEEEKAEARRIQVAYEAERAATPKEPPDS